MFYAVVTEEKALKPNRPIGGFFDKIKNFFLSLWSKITSFFKNIYKKLADVGYKKLIHKLVLVGGGAIALERYLKEDDNIIILENALWANVEGAEIIEKRRAK